MRQQRPPRHRTCAAALRQITKVVGAFPDGQSALMLVAARLRHVSTTAWGTRKYMNMKLLEEMDREAIFSAAWLTTGATPSQKVRKIIDSTPLSHGRCDASQIRDRNRVKCTRRFTSLQTDSPGTVSSRYYSPRPLPVSVCGPGSILKARSKPSKLFHPNLRHCTLEA